MLNSGKKGDQKNNYSNSRVALKKISERNIKQSPPFPFKLNGRSLSTLHLSGWKAIFHFPSHFANLSRSSCR